MAAKILHIEELSKSKNRGGEQVEDQLLGSNVRVLGKIIEVDLPRNRFRLEQNNRKSSIWIDSSLVRKFPHSTQTQYQVIGEVTRDPLDETLPTLMIKAKIVRDVQDLDLRLFELVLKERRKLFP